MVTASNGGKPMGNVARSRHEAVASQLLAMLPYIATIVVLALISRNPTWIRINMPASLGKAFHPGT